MIEFFMKKNRRRLDHSLGFHSRMTQTFFKSPLPSSKKINHFKLRRPSDFGLSVKGREVELWVSYNMINLVEIDGLSIFDHSVKRPGDSNCVNYGHTH
jgi:hypothetical protein